MLLICLVLIFLKKYQYKKNILIIALCITNLFVFGDTLYVRQYASSGNNGLHSWANAVNSFAEALELLNGDNPIYSSVTEVWVSRGTFAPLYKPSAYHIDGSVTTNRDKTFLLKGGIKYVGGFGGWETSPDEREDLFYFRTVLSGYMWGDNAYHVVTYAGEGLEPLSMDGFTIEGGVADESDLNTEINGCIINHGYGGGIYTKVRTTTSFNNFIPVFSLKNCIVRDNYAKEGGGGMYNAGTVYYHYFDDIQYVEYSVPSRISLTNVVMHDNLAWKIISARKYGGYGGAIFNDSAIQILELNHVTITDNSAAHSTIFFRNNLWDGSLGFYLWIDNSIITDNNNTYSTYEEIDHLDGWLNVSPTKSLVKGISGNPFDNYGMCGSCNIDGNLDPKFKNPGVYDPDNDVFPDYRLKPTSPCIFASNGLYSFSNLDIDLVQNSRAIGAYSNSNTNLPLKSLDAWGMPFVEETPEALDTDLELVIYPVPASNGDPLNVSLKGYNETVNLRLYSMDGRLIHDRIYDGGSFTINLPDLTSGIYIVKAHTQEGESFTKKIMINK